MCDVTPTAALNTVSCAFLFDVKVLLQSCINPVVDVFSFECCFKRKLLLQVGALSFARENRIREVTCTWCIRQADDLSPGCSSLTKN